MVDMAQHAHYCAWCGKLFYHAPEPPNIRSEYFYCPECVAMLAKEWEEKKKIWDRI